MTKQVEVPESTVELLARAINPGCFEKTNGLGHQEFAEDDREERAAARKKARDLLPSIYKHFSDRLLSDEAKAAVFDANARYQNVDPREQSEDGWAECLLSAALQAASIPEGSDQ